jgi:ribosomal-protein-alanine N-acetyltransferase
MIRFQNKELRAGRSYSLGLWIADGKSEIFIGQVTLGGIVLGAYRGGYIGYWIDQRFAGRGYTTRAVIALTNYAFSVLQLHRIEINLRPENIASKKVAEKAGYLYEGLRPRYLHIDQDWRDHSTFVKENPNI